MPLILLPPSEGKTAPTKDADATDTRSLQWDSLVFPELTEVRQQVGAALIAASNLPDNKALATLKAGKKILPEIRANVDLLTAQVAPAAEVYSGVLYEAAQLKPNDNVLIFSGLFGVTRASDEIPAYRCPMGVSLPGVGALQTVWKRACANLTLSDMQEATQSEDNVVFDARSSAYHVWPAKSHLSKSAIDDDQSRCADIQRAVPFWTLRAVNADGRVITHRAKHYRGLFTRALLDAGSVTNADIPDLVHNWREQQGFTDIDINTESREITVHVP